MYARLGAFFKFCLFIRSCYLVIQLFCYVLSVSIFYSKIVLFILHSIVDLSLCTFHQPVGRIFVCYFGKFCFVCIA